MSPQRLHWYPVGFVQGVGGGPARVSLSSVETSTGGTVELSPMIVTVLTGVTSDDSCYLELTQEDALRLSWLLGDAARLVGGQPADPWFDAL